MTAPIHTITLAKIRAASPCADGWTKLLTGLGYADGKYDPAHTVTLGDVARINGAQDALWCARCLGGDDARRSVVRAILPAVRRATAGARDMRVTDCVELVARWVDGDPAVTPRNLRDAADTAYCAYCAAYAAYAATNAAYAANAASYATNAAAYATNAATNATNAANAAITYAARAANAHAAERAQQVADIISVFGETR